VKHEEMKQAVSAIHKKEKIDDSKAKVQIGASENYAAPDFEIEDQFKLPYGLGFDHVIKKKADLINS
jgi:hypothetical protein